MASVKPEEAQRFYEEDEDPARVRALFDAARREGRVRQTTPPSRRPSPVPLRALLAVLMHDVERDLRELRIWERLARWLEDIASVLRSHTDAPSGPQRPGKPRQGARGKSGTSTRRR